MVVSQPHPSPYLSCFNIPASPPHGVFEQLRQDVVQGHGDEGEPSSHMSIDADAGGIAILVLTQASVCRSESSDLDHWFSPGDAAASTPPREVLQFLKTFLLVTTGKYY